MSAGVCGRGWEPMLASSGRMHAAFSHQAECMLHLSPCPSLHLLSRSTPPHSPLPVLLAPLPLCLPPTVAVAASVCACSCACACACVVWELTEKGGRWQYACTNRPEQPYCRGCGGNPTVWNEGIITCIIRYTFHSSRDGSRDGAQHPSSQHLSLPLVSHYI